MAILSKLLPTSPSGRRIVLCVTFVAVVNFMICCLRALVLFSDVRFNIVFDFINMFCLTAIGLSFCLDSNLKERLAALGCSLVLCLLTLIFCQGSVHAKTWRFQHPDNYSPVQIDEVTIQNKTIRLYLIRDQKFDCLMAARVEPINKEIALYWSLTRFGHTDKGKLTTYDDSVVVRCGQPPNIETKLIPLSEIP